MSPSLKNVVENERKTCKSSRDDGIGALGGTERPMIAVNTEVTSYTPDHINRAEIDVSCAWWQSNTAEINICSNQPDLQI